VTATNAHPLLDDREVDFQLWEVHALDELRAVPAFEGHSDETFRLTLQTLRGIARTVLFPGYRAADSAPPTLDHGAVRLHPAMHAAFEALAGSGLLAATRPVAVGGQQLPSLLMTAVAAYLSAAHPAAAGLAMLTTEAAHLIESFGDEDLRARYLEALYTGTMTGTMALTEPQAGSSLGDITTTARPAGDGTYRITGTKIFISGGAHDLTDNIVHLVLGRIEGAPEGTRGVSLFCVPRLRPEGEGVVGNDVHCTGVIHKIGWRALPSVVLSFGDAGDCHGWLVGAPGRGLPQMFQMMNAARTGVGVSGAAMAYAGYLESLAYARTRPQGRALTNRGTGPQVALLEHPDVRRMLLRQKAIAEGALSLVLAAARLADVSEHSPDPDARTRARLLLDLLTPVAKTFPAERGFESNVLSVQVLGGYGYTAEYLPELWMRDQKLNSIHEGTTGIQGLDLLGRKVVAAGGAALAAWADTVHEAIAQGRAAAIEPAWCDALDHAVATVTELTATLAARGLAGDVDAMLAHAADYLDLFATVCVAWQWVLHATAAQRAIDAGRGTAMHQGKLQTARYWITTELPRVEHLAHLCRSAENSYVAMEPGWW